MLDKPNFWRLICSDSYNKCLRRGSKMRRSSYILSFLTVALFLLSVGSAAQATGVDPSIGLGDTGSNGSFTQTQCLISDAICTLTLDSTGSGIADIFNDTGFHIISDTVKVDSPFDTPLVCDPNNPFGYNSVTGGTGSPTPNSCTYAEVPTNQINSIGTGSYGIHFNDFTLNGIALKTINFDLKWINNTTPTPEPGTLVLLGAGLVTLVASRKRPNATRDSV